MRKYFAAFLTVTIMISALSACTGTHQSEMTTSATDTDNFESLSLLINQRLSCMQAVARFKAVNHLVIEDIAQENRVLARSVSRAKALGLDAASVKPFITAQMNAAKAIQYRYRADWLIKPQLHQQPHHLDDLRSKIATLGDKLLVTLHAVLTDGTVMDDRRHRQFIRIVNQHHLSDEDREQLFNTLKAVKLNTNAPDIHNLTTMEDPAMSDKIPAHTEQLNTINQKILAPGESLPAVKLKDGSRVQTGTVATMLYNIMLYNQGERGAIERELELSVPTLIRIGLFELFPVDEWIAGYNPGRRFVGERAKAWLEHQR